MMTSQTVTIPEMMAWQTAPMPFTMAMRQLPMAWKIDVMQEQTAPILNYELSCSFVFENLVGLGSGRGFAAVRI